MKVLVLFLWAVMDFSLTEGRTVSKCELRDAVINKIFSLSEKTREKGLTAESLVAKIICHVEEASGFNTSVVYQLNPRRELYSRRGKRDHGSHFGTTRLHTQEKKQTNEPPSYNHSSLTTKPARLDEEVWTLYGLFQLSNHLVCSDGITPSPNICNIDCNNLVDDNITDDITCLLRILTDLVENGFSAAHWEDLRKMIRILFQEECRDKQPSVYFAECS